MRSVQINVWLVTACCICAVLGVPGAQANLLSDQSFENGIDPLPGLGAVVGPPFSPGFWGAEVGGEVMGERGVDPCHLRRMLYMEDDGLTVTQTFQAVDVSAFARLIDSGNGVANLSACYNTHLTTAPALRSSSGLLFYAGANDWNNPLDTFLTADTLDTNPGTWEVFQQSAPIPKGTRWILVQLGFQSAFLREHGPGARGYVDDAFLEVIPEPGTLTLLGAGLMLSLLRRRLMRTSGETSCL